MVVDAVVYDNRLRRRGPWGRAPVVTAPNVEALVDVDGTRWGLLITWLGPSTTVVKTDIDIVPVIVAAAVTHRGLDSGKRNFLWILIEMKQKDPRSRIIQSLDNIVCGNFGLLSRWLLYLAGDQRLRTLRQRGTHRVR
jgi:hypothetical protein